jgi:hypothetical protein
MLIVDSESRASTPTKHLVDEIVATYQQPHSNSDQHPLGMRAASDAVDSEFKQVDLERIGGHLDEWSEFMKKAVLGEISDSLKEYKSRLDSIERQYGGKMTGLKEELTDYRQLNESLKRELNSKEALLENLVVHQVFPISKVSVCHIYLFCE